MFVVLFSCLSCLCVINGWHHRLLHAVSFSPFNGSRLKENLNSFTNFEHGVFLNVFVLFLILLINSGTAIAGAIIGLLLVFFYFVVMIFVTTI